MIRVERDPAFWTAVASHPAVIGTLMGLEPSAVGALAGRADMLPLASVNGGFLFARTDALGFVCELHTLFTPEGWRREVSGAAKEAFNAVFLLGFQVVTTFEVAANARSQPPRSFGFVQAGDWRETPLGKLRLWTLSRAGWEASPANRRLRCQLH